MTYARIHPIITAWASTIGAAVLKEESPPHRRFLHVSNTSETFQFVVEPERDGLVRIDAHLIESDYDDRVHFMWEFPSDNLPVMLDLSTYSINAWFQRERSQVPRQR